MKLTGNYYHLLAMLLLLCSGCTGGSDTEKYQSKRDHVINVRNKVKKIQIEDVLISSLINMYSIDKYLIIVDHKSSDKLIHIFSKADFSHLTSTAYKGQGPDEITMIGHVGIDEARRRFYVSDHGKQCIFDYNLDSLLADPLYLPSVKTRMKERLFPDKYHYINDTLSIARIIAPTGNSGFEEYVAKWNMETGEIVPLQYKHPEIEKRRVSIAVSPANNLYVECYHHHDLFTICSLDGNLRYNIYGSKWDNMKTNNVRFYGSVVFCNNRIVASYSAGEDNFAKDSYPTSLLVFDITGNYIQTLETGYPINHFCYDKENNRIIMNLADEIQFAYLDLEGI